MRRRLRSIGSSTLALLSIVALAAAWFVHADGAAAASLSWSPPTLIDTAPSGEVFGALSCPSAAFCVAADQSGGVATTTDPGGSAPWTLSRVAAYRGLTSAPAIQSLSCPTVGLCVGVDQGGDVYSTTTPNGGPRAWRGVMLPTIDGIGSSVSCPTTTLCVVTSADAGLVFTAADPTGGSGAWVSSTVPGSNGSESDVACPSAGFCAVAAGDGLVFTSTNPAGGGTTYAAHQVVAAGKQAAPDITAIACPTETLCVAGDADGDVLTSTDPASPAATWHAQQIDRDTSVAAIACRVSGVCTAIDGNGVLYATAAAAAASPAWSQVASNASALDGSEGTATFALACPTDTLCLAVDGTSDVPRSTSPTVPGSWRIAAPRSDSGASLDALSCPSLRLCVALDASGNVLSTRTPENPHSWHSAHVDDAGELVGLSCPTRSFCLATDTSGDVLISTNPTGGARAWHAHMIEQGEDGGNGPPTGLMGVSCVSAHFCMTGDENPGDVLTASNPWGGAQDWLHHGSDGPGDGLIDASCPSVGFCGVVDANGQIDAFTPAGSAHFTNVSPPVGLGAIACPSARLCVAVAGGINAANVIGQEQDGGGIWSSTDPTAPHPRWRLAHPDLDEQLAVACHALALCVAADIDGNASVSLDPAAHRPSWTTTAIDPNAVFTGVSCPTSRLCVVADDDGNIWMARRLTPAAHASVRLPDSPRSL